MQATPPYQVQHRRSHARVRTIGHPIDEITNRQSHLSDRLNRLAMVWRDCILAPIASEESDIGSPLRRRLGGDLVSPPFSLNDIASQVQNPCDIIVIKPSSRLHVNDDRAGISIEQEVRNMPPHDTIDLSREKEGLSHDAPDLIVEVCEHQVGEFQAGLIDHQIAGSARPVPARIVFLPPVPAKCTPRRCRAKVFHCGRVPLHGPLTEILTAAERNFYRGPRGAAGRHALTVPPPPARCGDAARRVPNSWRIRQLSAMYLGIPPRNLGPYKDAVSPWPCPRSGSSAAGGRR